ncbi:MAG TPA: hypothetical protein VK195_13960, partial [Burkholderiaceae bacterium]|nr:hypothetical protein [Burkholderiaceae bacterium]
MLAQVDLLVQSLTAMYGDRFSASLMLAEDEFGTQQPVHTGPKTAKLFQATVFNLTELKARVEKASAWSEVVDPAGKKALFYFEHACLLIEFSETLSLTSPHAAFS